MQPLQVSASSSVTCGCVHVCKGRRWSIKFPPAPSYCFLINKSMLKDQSIQQALLFRLVILTFVLSWVSGFLRAFYRLCWNTFDHYWLTFLTISLSIPLKIKQKLLSEFITQDIGSMVTETLHTFLGLLLLFLSCFVLGFVIFALFSDESRSGEL